MDKNSPCFNCQTGWGNVSVFDGNGNIVNHGKVCFEECEKYKYTASKQLTQSIPHYCPVCGGNGLVPNGFYTSGLGHWSTTSTMPEKCRSCGGKGYILI